MSDKNNRNIKEGVIGPNLMKPQVITLKTPGVDYNHTLSSNS